MQKTDMAALPADMQESPCYIIRPERRYYRNVGLTLALSRMVGHPSPTNKSTKGLVLWLRTKTYLVPVPP